MTAQDHEIAARELAAALREAVRNGEHADSCPGPVVPRACHCWIRDARAVLARHPYPAPLRSL